jgi:hypothetical protein
MESIVLNSKSSNHKLQEVNDIVEKINKLEKKIESKKIELVHDINFINEIYNNTLNDFHTIIKNLLPT